MDNIKITDFENEWNIINLTNDKDKLIDKEKKPSIIIKTKYRLYSPIRNNIITKKKID